MVGRQRMAKFHRATPIVRREALVEATLRSLEEFGHDGTSIRRISAAAGVSIGLINHHFRSKAELIAAAYETLAVSLQESMRAQSGNEADLPRTRLSGFFTVMGRVSLICSAFETELLDERPTPFFFRTRTNK